MSILTTSQKTFVDLTDRTIVSVVTEYAKNASSSSAPSSGWSTTAPLWEDGKYIWSRIKTTYNIIDPDTGLDYTISNPVCATGSKGQTGVGVTSIIKWYYASTSESSITGGTWVTVAPAYDSNKYLWTKEITTFDDGTTSETTAVLDQEWKTLVEFKGTLDGKIETWFYSGRPSSAVLPESQWSSEDVKRTHVGDNYYDTDSGYVYTYKEDTYQETNVTSPIYTFNLPSDVQNKAELKSISGRTIVWNQLAGAPLSSIPSGMTYNGDGSYTINTTISGSDSWWIKIVDGVGTIAGHKYYATVNNLSKSNITISNDGHGMNVNSGIASQVETFPRIYIRVPPNTYTNVVIKPQVFDLTQMFGSGNEPSTVAEFKAIFPHVYYPYNAGGLLSGKCDKVVSVEKNLYDITKTNTDAFNITNGKLSNRVIDSGRSFFRFNLQNVDNGYSNIVSVDYSTTGNKSKSFTISTHCYVRIVHNGASSNLQFTQNNLSLEAGTYTVSFNLEGCDPSVVGGLVISDFMIERGLTATTYKEYVEHEYTIPSAIQQLPGYGWSAGSVFNEVNFVNKKYIQRVGSADLGDFNWVKNTNGNFYATKPTNSTNIDYTAMPNAIVPCYTYSALAYGTVSANMTFCFETTRIWMTNTTHTDAAAFKTAMSGVIIYYELAEPIETDISAYLPVDNSIEIESGGTIILHQSNDIRIKLPNSITYLSKLASGTCFRWEKITDSAVALAMKNASTAQITADNKMQVFVSQPTPPYDVGDLWTESGKNDGDIMRCSTARASGDFDARDWVKANTSTDNLIDDLADGNGTTTIAGNHITTGTIDASQVTVDNIDADNITSGTISADRVRTGTLESVNSDVKIDLDNGVIGIVGAKINENLVLNSCCTFHTGSSSYPCAWFDLSENAISGVTYTISANFMISGDIKRIFAFVGSSEGGTPFAGDFVVSQNPVSSGTYRFTFTANENHTPNRRIYIYASHISSGQPVPPVGGTCFVNWVKMEVGSQATAWCPAKSEKNEGKNIILNNTVKNRGQTPFTYAIGYYNQSETMVAGQTYKLTIDVNLNPNIKRIFCFGGNGTSGDGAYYVCEWNDYSGLSSGIYSLIFIASANNASSVKTVELWAQDTIGSGSNRSTYCILNSIKLEKWYGIAGTTSTPKNPTSDETDADLRLRGKVSFDSIRDSGSTIINGDNIKTGSIASNNYSYSSGNFSDAGSILDLSDGMIRTKNLYTKGDELKLKGEVNTEAPVDQTYLPSQYSASDITRINGIIAGSITPTTSDYNKYALWHDYSIDSDCRDCIQHLINGTSTKLEFLYTANLGDSWSKGNGVEVMATVRETRANGSVTNSSRDLFTSGADGTYVKNLYADGIYTGGNNFLPLRYIKAQGTANGWTYRKWSDGVLEQWRNTTETFASSSWQSWGVLYQTNLGVSYFFGVAFSSTPTLTIQCITNTWGIPMTNDLGTTGFKLFAVRPNAPTVSATIGFSMYAVGRWN